MIRKLFSIVLCAFAMLLLMGASSASPEEGGVPASEGTSLFDLEASTQNQEESASQPAEKFPDSAVPAAAGTDPLLQESKLMIDGIQAPAGMGRFEEEGVTYVALAPMIQAMDETAQADWNEEESTITVTREGLELRAKVGQLYLEVNGRYLYLPQGVRMVSGRVTVPLWAVVKALDAQSAWNEDANALTLTRGSGAIQSGDEFYDKESLFWLSRIIYAESGNQPLTGKIAVGNVVMNRVANPYYPDTVEGVLAQKNQFSPYRGGRLAKRTPNDSSVVAAKLVLDGGVVEGLEEALYFDSSEKSWAAQNKECVAVIGGHKFYR